MINLKQLRTAIIKPVLIQFNLYSESAEELLIGTAIAESVINGEQYLKHISGRSLGIYRMEIATHNWIKEYIKQKRLYKIIDWIDSTGGFNHNRLVYDLYYATLMARLRYLIVPIDLPKKDDVDGMAKYWKKYYNTERGKGTIEGFIKKYLKFNRE